VCSNSDRKCLTKTRSGVTTVYLGGSWEEELQTGTTRLMVLSTYWEIVKASCDSGTMSLGICAFAACLRRPLEAGDLVPDLESSPTFPAILLRP
jgi:hypothetical protein